MTERIQRIETRVGKEGVYTVVDADQFVGINRRIWWLFAKD
jgi:hypothetical protein